jgi:predicted nucleic-acid-binding protein
MIIDTNFIIRYLLNDIEKQFKVAKEFIENNKIFIPNEIIAESVYVLEKVYDIPKVEIKKALTALIQYPNISTSNKELLISSLKVYSKTNFDYIDCLLVAYKEHTNENIKTFDKKLQNYLNKH